MNDLSPESIRRALPAWVPEARFLEQTDSTNKQALEWAGRGAAHGCVVVADHQTAGRGRLDRSWWSPAGTGLLLSVILRPRADPAAWGLLSAAGAVALCEYLEELGVAAAVKWPNDVLIGGRKAAGILAETADGAVALGIGVNVAQVEFPPELAGTATSLKLAAGRHFDRLEVLAGSVARLEPLVDGPLEAVREAFRSRCATLGTVVRVELDSAFIVARAVDIDPAGGLVLEDGRTVRAGDVTQLR